MNKTEVNYKLLEHLVSTSSSEHQFALGEADKTVEGVFTKNGSEIRMRTGFVLSIPESIESFEDYCHESVQLSPYSIKNIEFENNEIIFVFDELSDDDKTSSDYEAPVVLFKLKEDYFLGYSEVPVLAKVYVDEARLQNHIDILQEEARLEQLATGEDMSQKIEWLKSASLEDLENDAWSFVFKDQHGYFFIPFVADDILFVDKDDLNLLETKTAKELIDSVIVVKNDIDQGNELLAHIMSFENEVRFVSHETAVDLVREKLGVESTKPKLFVCAHGTHGKDEVLVVAKKFGLTGISSSEFCAQKLLFPLMKDTHNYSTWQECHADRRNHRDIWYTTINDYVKDDLSKLAREIFAEYDIYVGCRDDKEFQASKHLANRSLWIDAFERTRYLEPETSMKITAEMCDDVITNNGTIEEFHQTLHDYFSTILQ